MLRIIKNINGVTRDGRVAPVPGVAERSRKQLAVCKTKSHLAARCQHKRGYSVMQGWMLGVRHVRVLCRNG